MGKSTKIFYLEKIVNRNELHGGDMEGVFPCIGFLVTFVEESNGIILEKNRIGIEDMSAVAADEINPIDIVFVSVLTDGDEASGVHPRVGGGAGDDFGDVGGFVHGLSILWLTKTIIAK